MDPEIIKAIEDLVARLEETIPEVADVIQALKNGHLDQAEALSTLMRMIQENPDLPGQIEQAGLDAFQSLRGPNDDSPLTVQLEGENVPVITKTGPGLPSLNPLYEAALAERIQFDEDIPEARTQPLPPDGKPAVPVDTKSRSMTAIGQMLESASEKVADELHEAREKAIKDVKPKIMEQHPLEGEFHKTSDALTRPEPITLEEWAAKTQADEQLAEAIKGHEPEGYKTGQVPAHRATQEPSGRLLAAMSPQDRSRAAWKALSTTQGRRTALGALAEMISDGLANEMINLPVEIKPTGRLQDDERVEIYEVWTVQLAGPKATQPNFAFINTAAKTLLAKLVEHDLTRFGEEATLQVIPVNTVNVNQVGWAARVVSRV